jgi:NAD(P)-dependent dehydrogenase (short-subunit alcohol dehydrogenase family)
VKADVAKSAEVDAMVAQTIERYGLLHYAFNNAGIEGTPFVPTAKYLESKWDEARLNGAVGLMVKRT